MVVVENLRMLLHCLLNSFDKWNLMKWEINNQTVEMDRGSDPVKYALLTPDLKLLHAYRPGTGWRRINLPSRFFGSYLMLIFLSMIFSICTYC